MLAVRMTLATWFGTGYAPVASGTVGTLATVPLVLLLAWADSPALYLGATLVLVLLGLWAASGGERYLGTKDPGPVVVDEVAGFLVTMALLPVTPGTLVGGFFLFRLLDIVKPFPGRQAERLPGGWGIMVDDLIAGLYANLVLRLALALLEA